MIRAGVTRFATALLDFVYPPHCPVCEAWMPPEGRQTLCVACVAALPASGPRCLRCSAPLQDACPGPNCANCQRRPVTEFSRALVLSDFRGVPHDAIHRLKFNGIKQIGPFLGICVASFAPFERPLSGLDVLIPVPLHAARQRQRGFNQAQQIALGLGNALGIPINAAALQRVRPTRQQARLDSAARAANVHGAFTATHPLPGAVRRVGLVDDVMTTGATLSACAGALRTVFAGEIVAVTVASPFRRQTEPDSVDLIHSPT